MSKPAAPDEKATTDKSKQPKQDEEQKLEQAQEEAAEERKDVRGYQ